MIHITKEANKAIQDMTDYETVKLIYRVERRKLAKLLSQYRFSVMENSTSIWVYKKIPFLGLLSYLRRMNLLLI